MKLVFEFFLSKFSSVKEVGDGGGNGTRWDRFSLSSLERFGEQPLTSLVITFYVSFGQIHIKKKKHARDPGVPSSSRQLVPMFLP